MPAACAAVSGATVTVTNKATGAIRRAVTNSEGVYAFPALLPGAYELKVEQAGFKKAVLDNITLEVQQTSRRDVTHLDVRQAARRDAGGATYRRGIPATTHSGFAVPGR